MQSEVQNHLIYSDNCIDGYLKILIYIIKRAWEKSLNSASQNSSAVLSSILEYFKNNYGKQINVTEYFESIGYSYHHLRHTFKEIYGVSPNQYLTKIRIEAAKKLLLSTDLSIEDISKKSGFNSLSHFTSNFKKYTGKTPAEFRSERG